LRESSVKVVLEGVGIREIDRVWLMRVLGYVGQMESKSLAETTELDFALVLQTKFERLLCDLLEEN
jgi:hypothetical protein